MSRELLHFGQQCEAELRHVESVYYCGLPVGHDGAHMSIRVRDACGSCGGHDAHAQGCPDEGSMGGPDETFTWDREEDQ